MEKLESFTSEISQMMATEVRKLLQEAVKEMRSEIIPQMKEEMINIIKVFLRNSSQPHPMHITVTIKELFVGSQHGLGIATACPT